MTGTLSLQELEGRLWDAADSLRAPVDRADVKADVVTGERFDGAYASIREND